jgi:hypothetical protein
MGRSLEPDSRRLEGLESNAGTQKAGDRFRCRGRIEHLGRSVERWIPRSVERVPMQLITRLR